MKLTFYSFLVGISLFSTQLYSQSLNTEWFILPNGNLYLPAGGSNKGVYPILGYDKTTKPHVLIGGLGCGVSFIKPLRRDVSWRGQGNLSKHTYWDEPIALTAPIGVSLGAYLAGSSDYSIGLSTTIHYSLTDRISIGTGVGAQFLLLSLARLPKLDDHSQPTLEAITVSKHYKYVVPVLPIELAVKLNKALLVNIRYEYSLINRLRGDLSQAKTEKYGLLTFELGIKLK